MVYVSVFIYVLSCTTLVRSPVQAHDFAGIARSARAEAETEVRRRNEVSLARSARTGPTAYRLRTRKIVTRLCLGPKLMLNS